MLTSNPFPLLQILITKNSINLSAGWAKDLLHPWRQFSVLLQWEKTALFCELKKFSWIECCINCDSKPRHVDLLLCCFMQSHMIAVAHRKKPLSNPHVLWWKKVFVFLFTCYQNTQSFVQNTLQFVIKIPIVLRNFMRKKL